MAASFTCPKCQATSHNANDVREGYCGRCHDWTTSAGEPPPGYSDALEALGRCVDHWMDAIRVPPRFAFPPKAIVIVGDLGDVGMRFVRNEAAAEFLRHLMPAWDRGESTKRPTVAMLRVVLDARGIPYDTVTVGELGISPTGSVPS